MLKKFFLQIFFIFIILILFNFFSCSLSSGYELKGTSWTFELLNVKVILEFETDEDVIHSAIEPFFKTVERNIRKYTFDKQNLTGYIEIDGINHSFTIDEQNNNLNLDWGNNVILKFNKQDFNWPAFSLFSLKYVGLFEPDETSNIEVYFSDSNTVRISFIDNSTGAETSYQYYNYEWDNFYYSVKVYNSENTYWFNVSIDAKVLIVNPTSDYPTYCYLSN